MTRLWYHDGTYMDVFTEDAAEYECDPNWSYSEVLTFNDVWIVENGKRMYLRY